MSVVNNDLLGFYTRGIGLRMLQIHQRERKECGKVVEPKRLGELSELHCCQAHVAAEASNLLWCALRNSQGEHLAPPGFRVWAHPNANDAGPNTIIRSTGVAHALRHLNSTMEQWLRAMASASAGARQPADAELVPRGVCTRAIQKAPVVDKGVADPTCGTMQ